MDLLWNSGISSAVTGVLISLLFLWQTNYNLDSAFSLIQFRLRFLHLIMNQTNFVTRKIKIWSSSSWRSVNKSAKTLCKTESTVRANNAPILLNELFIKNIQGLQKVHFLPRIYNKKTLDPGNAYIWTKKVTFGVSENVYIFPKIGDLGDTLAPIETYLSF